MCVRCACAPSSVFFCFGGFVLEILFLGDSFSDMKGLWASCQRTDCFPIGRDYRQQVKRKKEREREREREREKVL